MKQLMKSIKVNQKVEKIGMIGMWNALSCNQEILSLSDKMS